MSIIDNRNSGEYEVETLTSLPNVTENTLDVFDYKTRKSFTVPKEMMHFVYVLAKSIESGKREPDNWLLPDGDTMQRLRNLHSISNHFTALAQGENIDKDSGLHHALAVACRALMLYTRDQRGIKHPLDE